MYVQVLEATLTYVFGSFQFLHCTNELRRGLVPGIIKCYATIIL
jgi:hypothetical protein